ncbi:MAG: glycosyltransferase family 4 protein [Cyclobacteriaceae bacterium]|nr:glycosyltransferase family 4 protein [Cyclobacteriaceae bacterium]
MKIGIEVQRLYRQERYGIETSAIDLVNALYGLKTKHDFFIYAKNYNNNLQTDTKDFNVRFIHGKFFVDSEQVFLPLAAAKDKLDLLHCTGNTTPIFSKVPIIQTLHDVIFMDSIPSSDTLYQRLGNYYRRLVVPCVSQKSKLIVTVSEFEKQRIIKRLGISPDKIHVIHNGISNSFKRVNDQQELSRIKQKYNLTDTYILFLGNSSQRKNPIRVIEAYLKYVQRTNEPIPLVTPNLTRDYLAHQLQRLSQKKLINNFITPGYIQREDMPHLFSLSSLFLFPSLSEGFGMPVLEAMACKVPVVTSNLSSLPEISGNAAWSINPFNIEELADAMLTLLDSDTHRSNLVEEGTKQIAKFSWKRSAEKYIELYERIGAKGS